MDLKTAYTTLGLEEGASKEDAKKAFKKLAAKFHPDKQDGDEAKFKEVNEAYQLIDTGKDFGPTTRQSSPHPGGYGMPIDLEDLIRQAHGGNPFNNRRKQVRPIQERNINTTISFKESILGCQRQLNYKRLVKCSPCEGNGLKTISNGCKICGGTGFITQVRGNLHMRTTCSSCGGMQRMESCTECKETGSVEADVTVSVNIPAGVSNEKNILNLRGMGDYVGSNFMMDQHMDAHLFVTIESQKGLKLVGDDVVTECDITLLEALEGTKVKVETIDGPKEITLHSGIKNANEIVLSKLGVDRKGHERVIVNVHYPASLQSIIEVLKNTKES